MEITNPLSILKYLNITLYSYSRICYFTSLDEPNNKFKTRFLNVTSEGLMMQISGIPKNTEGYLVFYSYTFIFRFKAQLRMGLDEYTYFCAIPKKLETFDRRKFPRLKFESRENKVISIYNKAFDLKIKGILSDISVGGIGFSVIDMADAPKIDDIIVTNIDMPGKSFQAIAKVIQVREDFVGCIFLGDAKHFQNDLNTIVKDEIEWRSELMLQNLKKREEIIHAFNKKQEKTSSANLTIAEMIGSKDVLYPLIEFIISSFHEATGIILSREKMEYKESTALSSLISLQFDINFFSDSLFSCFLFTQKEILYKLTGPLFGDKLSGMALNSNLITDQLGKKLKTYSDGLEEKKRIFQIANPLAQETNKRMISDLLRQPSIQVRFSSSIGNFHLVLMSPKLEESLALCANAKPREFITLEKMDLLEPISYSALRVFTEYLKLEIREKSVTSRDQLLPRFEISIILDIFFQECEGKVILNLSKKLALKIYELLLNEKAEDFNNEVKDAIAELTNMITGNAKSEFEKSGIYYKISTPVVLESREGVLIYARNMKFLSSVYWTSEGFFDLSFSFFKR